VKQFSADEIVALSFAFDVPVSRLLAPPDRPVHGRPPLIRIAGTAPRGAEILPAGFFSVTVRQERIEEDDRYAPIRSAILIALLDFLSRDYAGKISSYGVDGVLAREQLAREFGEIQTKLGMVPKGRGAERRVLVRLRRAIEQIRKERRRSTRGA
jgi:hypothetical protein